MKRLQTLSELLPSRDALNNLAHQLVEIVGTVLTEQNAANCIRDYFIETNAQVDKLTDELVDFYYTNDQSYNSVHKKSIDNEIIDIFLFNSLDRNSNSNFGKISVKAKISTIELLLSCNKCFPNYSNYEDINKCELYIFNLLTYKWEIWDGSTSNTLYNHDFICIQSKSNDANTQAVTSRANSVHISIANEHLQSPMPVTIIGINSCDYKHGYKNPFGITIESTTDSKVIINNTTLASADAPSVAPNSDDLVDSDTDVEKDVNTSYSKLRKSNTKLTIANASNAASDALHGHEEEDAIDVLEYLPVSKHNVTKTYGSSSFSSSNRNNYGNNSVLNSTDDNNNSASNNNKGNEFHENNQDCSDFVNATMSDYAMIEKENGIDTHKLVKVIDYLNHNNYKFVHIKQYMNALELGNLVADTFEYFDVTNITLYRAQYSSEQNEEEKEYNILVISSYLLENNDTIEFRYKKVCRYEISIVLVSVLFV